MEDKYQLSVIEFKPLDGDNGNFCHLMKTKNYLTTHRLCP